MPSRQRLVLVGLAIVVLIAAFAVARSGDSSSKTDANANRPAVVTIKGGKPVGGIKTFTFTKGKTIDLTVHSDTADEVHFHGYDVHKDVTKGGTVRFRMPATIEGGFIVELENAGQQIASVRVIP